MIETCCPLILLTPCNYLSLNFVELKCSLFALNFFEFKNLGFHQMALTNNYGIHVKVNKRHQGFEL